MYKHLLVLPDGTELFSGVPGQAAIGQVTVTECINTEEELTPGCVCAGLLEAQVLIPGEFSLRAGEWVKLFRVAPDGSRSLAGIFRMEKPERAGKHLYKLTGYDPICCLDAELTQWLETLEGWPYRLYDLARMVCDRCGLVLETQQIPNGDHPVQRFAAAGITGRQLMQWIAQASCRFCRATPEGNVVLDWYREVPLILVSPCAGPEVAVRGNTLAIRGQGVDDTWDADRLSLESQQLESVADGQTLQLTAKQVLPYRSGGLTLGDYQTAPVERVRICQNREDVGTVYPDDPGEKNTYILQGNPLLSADHADTLRPVAETIYSILSRDTYTPGTVSLSTNPAVQVGQILTVEAPEKSVRLYVMQCVRTGWQDRLECTGSPNRQCSSAVNGQSYGQLQGKVLELRTDVDGIRAENRDNAGRAARLELDVAGLRTQVSHQEKTEQGIRESLSRLEQTTQGLTLAVESARQTGAEKVVTGAGYSFTDSGLQIRRAGEQMENLLDHTGMYVRRAGEVMLQANKDGVVAADVQVRNYLILGTGSRLEDYKNAAGKQRTACFWIGG